VANDTARPKRYDPAGVRLAAIDIGTNSVHMVIADVTRVGQIRVVDRMKEMVRLGEGTFRTGRLGAEPMTRTIEALQSFRRLARARHVTKLRAVATSAVREARNGATFVARLRRETKIPVQVISGAEEAHLIYRAVQHAFDLREEPALLVDVGGGSVELTLVEGELPDWYRSLPLGVGRLAERFLAHDPPTPRHIARLEAHVDAEIEPVLEAVRHAGVRSAIGTSGTMTSLVTMALAERGEVTGRLEGATVPRAMLTRLKRRIMRLSAAERLTLPAVDAKRNDQLPAAVVLIDRIMQRAGLTELRLCTWALREGLLLELAEVPTTRTARTPSARHRSVAGLARHFAGTSPHGRQVAVLADVLFDNLGDVLKLPPDGRELLEHAAVLHDIGHAISRDRHHRHTAYLIRSSELLGFEPVEVEILAQVARAHRKQPPKSSAPELLALPPRARHLVRGLAALLRVADALDRTHFGVVKHLDVRVTPKHVTIEIESGAEHAELETWAAERRIDFLARLANRRVVVEHRHVRRRV
jgi:exopolyphosphatase/guanosine-5'-triphosphate,3'-diphosphate pyrophosphatase